ncbi:MAG: M15 family metallopeptidase [Candidatus Saccharimonadaceae bacterium]
MQKRILTYDEAKNIKFGDTKEQLVKANKYDTRIICEYQKFDMFAWTGFDILVRESVAKKLAEANITLQQKYGYTLKVVYGYRSIEIQRQYFNKRYDELKLSNPTMNNDELSRLTHNYVAVPDTAGHTLGAAVDLTIIDTQGECDMGTPVADFSDPIAIQTFAPVKTEQAWRRKILLTTMMEAGFAPFLGEWWHFSYGDKEWAAYYGRKSALYAPIETSKQTRLYLIAGGNKTALQTVDSWRGVDCNKMAGDALMKTFTAIDQVGILYKDTNKLEMAGGEFCGNASAATAALLSEDSNVQSYKVSGFNGAINSTVKKYSAKKWGVTTTFGSMPYQLSRINIQSNPTDIVNFGGIAHILLEGDLPVEYLLEAKKIRDKAQLDNDAVGVIWYKRTNDIVRINPIVWVKNINTQFYESSCGSGTIAAAIISGVNKIEQPSGKSIVVSLSEGSIQTESDIQEIAF